MEKGSAGYRVRAAQWREGLVTNRPLETYRIAVAQHGVYTELKGIMVGKK